MAAAVRTLEPELCAYARTNCNENPDTTPATISALQQWIKKSPHLKASTNPQLLLAFLRRCQFSLEDTKKRIDNYYSLKNTFPEVLCERSLKDELMELYGTGIHVIPKNTISNTGSALVISQFVKCDPKKSHPREAFKLLFMLLEVLAMESDNASIVGLSYVIDSRDVTVEQMLQYDPFLLKKIWMLVNRCMPLKFNEIHIINLRRDGQAVFSFVSSLLPPKMPFKFIVHNKAEDLYAHLARESMTVEYGGHNGYQAEALNCWEKKLRAYEQHFADDARYGTNERLRIGQSKNCEVGELSGVSGSFRKLAVD